MKVNFHVPFWRRAVQATEPLSLITLGTWDFAQLLQPIIYFVFANPQKAGAARIGVF